MNAGRVARILLKIAAVLAAGFVVSVGVAWGPAYIGLAGARSSPWWKAWEQASQRIVLINGLLPDDPGVVLRATAFGEDRFVVVAHDWSQWHQGVVSLTGSTADADGAVWRTDELRPDATPFDMPLVSQARGQEGAEDSYECSAVGWPWRMFHGVELQGFAPGIHTVGMVEAPRLWGKREVVHLPVSPLWAGFVGDIAVFAGVSWFAVAGWKEVRRRIRAWRGRCGTCGYDLSGNIGGRCPECGGEQVITDPDLRRSASGPASGGALGAWAPSDA